MRYRKKVERVRTGVIVGHVIIVYVRGVRKGKEQRAKSKGRRASPFAAGSRKLDVMPPIKSAEVIINDRSGFQDKVEVRRRLEELFAASGVAAKISIAKSGSQVAELARRSARGSSQVLVAGGGDGTISAVASAIVASDRVLGILPLGTLNHFAQDLKIPLDVENAARVIIAGHTTNIDVGEVNGHIFLNNSSLGLYPTIVSEREKQQSLGYGKWPAFAWAALTVLRRYPFLDVRLNADGKKFSRRTPFVFIGNNEYAMESFKIGRRDCLNGGRLSLYITNRMGRLGLIRIALRALLGRLRNDKDFLAMCTEEVTIETRRKHLRAAFDGEVDVLETPLHYRVRPGALRVIVPEQEKE
jgi:YegS/Rv2252/BmrU family lipid kinase